MYNTSVKSEELQQLVDKANNGNSDNNDAVFILAAMFESMSKHLKELKSQQIEILSKIDNVSSRLDRIESYTTDYVLRAIVED